MSIEGGKFLDKKYSDLTGSHEVSRAVERTRLDPDRDSIPHARDERIEAYLDRIDDIAGDGRGFDLLKYKILEKHVTKPEDVPEKYWENQEIEERKVGKGADWDRAHSEPELLARLKQEHLGAVLGDQRASLEQWIDYFGNADSDYAPKELKYWVLRSVLGMQEMVKKKDGDREYIEFPKRSRGTVSRFPDLNYDAFSQVIDAVETKYEGRDIEFEHDIQLDERAEFKKFLEKEDFSKLYAWTSERMSAVPEHLLPITEGEWVKYAQGSAPYKLVETIRGKGTGWCTAGMNTAAIQLKGGDFHVYYTLDDDGQATIPRLAIRMEGHDKIAEPPRGIAYKQNIDSYIPPILESKLEEFGTVGEQYKKRVKDMERLTSVEQKIQTGVDLDVTELRFLYEVDSTIDGFGYRKDPRIAELRQSRDRQKDIGIICDCPPEAVVTNIHDLTESTQVFCKDDGAKLLFVDFREPKNQEKLSQIIEFSRVFRETDSEATLDVAIEGGIVSIDLKPETIQVLESYQSAKQAYEAADGTPTYIYSTLENIPWQQPEATSFEVLIMDYGRTTPEQRDQLVSGMDKAGYRPLTFSELVALGIERPDLNKRNEVLHTYEKHMLVGYWLAPYLGWGGGERYLYADDVSNGWDDRSRFLFVRK